MSSESIYPQGQGNRHRWAFLALVIGAVLMLLSACGGSDEETTSSAEEAEAPTATTTAQKECEEPSGEPITIGYISAITGPLGVYGLGDEKAAQLQIDEINCEGGVLGRPLELEYADYASDPNEARKIASRMVSEDVAMIVMNSSGAARDAVIPVTEKAGVPYFFASQAEGKTCEAYTVNTGEVPSQQLREPIKYLMDKTGKSKWYIIGSDYIYPQVSAEVARDYITELGGEVVGEEMVPLETADYAPAIQKIADAEPELLLSILVGADAIAFEQQAPDFGLGQDELPRLAPAYDDGMLSEVGGDLIAGALTAVSFFESADRPEIKEFVESYKAEYGDDAPRLNTYAAHGALSIKVWAAAAEAAGSIESDEVMAALPGTEVDTLVGPTRVEKTHFLAQPVMVGEASEDGAFKVVETYDLVQPDEPCSPGK